VLLGSVAPGISVSLTGYLSDKRRYALAVVIETGKVLPRPAARGGMRWTLELTASAAILSSRAFRLLAKAGDEGRDARGVTPESRHLCPTSAFVPTASAQAASDCNRQPWARLWGRALCCLLVSIDPGDANPPGPVFGQS
jgi:hypothetical protein